MHDHNDPHNSLRDSRLWQNPHACAVNYEGDIAEGAKYLGFAKARLRHLLKNMPGATSAVYQPAEDVEIEVYTRPNRIRIKAGLELTVIANASKIVTTPVPNDSWLFKNATVTPKIKQDYLGLGQYWYSEDKKRALSWTSLPLFNPVVSPTTPVIKTLYFRGKKYLYPGALADSVHLLAACFVRPDHAQIIRANRAGIDGPLLWLALGERVIINPFFNSSESRLTAIQAFWLDTPNQTLNPVALDLKVAIPAVTGVQAYLDVSFSKQSDCLLVSYRVNTGNTKIDRYDLNLSNDGTLTTARDELVTLEIPVTQDSIDAIVYADMAADSYWFVHGYWARSGSATGGMYGGSSSYTYDYQLRLGKVELASNAVTLNVKTLYTETLTATGSGSLNTETGVSAGAFTNDNLMLTFGFYDAASDVALFLLIKQSQSMTVATTVETTTNQTATAYRYANGAAAPIGQVLPAFTDVEILSTEARYINPQFSNESVTLGVLKRLVLANGNVTFPPPSSGIPPRFSHDNAAMISTNAPSALFNWFKDGFLNSNNWTYDPRTQFAALHTKISKGENNKVLAYHFGIAFSTVMTPGHPDFEFINNGKFNIDQVLVPMPLDFTFDNVSVTK